MLRLKAFHVSSYLRVVILRNSLSVDDNIYIYIYIYIYISSSSSSCHAISTDIPYLFSPSLSIVHCFRQVLSATPASSYSSCMQVRAGRPAFARPCEGVPRSTSLMSSSLLLQQCLECLVRLILTVFVMSARWPYSSCFVWCCLQDLFNIARSILVQLPSSFFSS